MAAPKAMLLKNAAPMPKLATIPSEIVRFFSRRVGIVALSPRRVCRIQNAACERTEPTMRPMAVESDQESVADQRDTQSRRTLDPGILQDQQKHGNAAEHEARRRQLSVSVR